MLFVGSGDLYNIIVLYRVIEFEITQLLIHI